MLNVVPSSLGGDNWYRFRRSNNFLFVFDFKNPAQPLQVSMERSFWYSFMKIVRCVLIVESFFFVLGTVVNTTSHKINVKKLNFSPVTSTLCLQLTKSYTIRHAKQFDYLDSAFAGEINLPDKERDQPTIRDKQTKWAEWITEVWEIHWRHSTLPLRPHFSNALF